MAITILKVKFELEENVLSELLNMSSIMKNLYRTTKGMLVIFCMIT